MTQRNPIAPYIKRQIYEQQNGLCAYCGRHRTVKHMTIDHKMPLSRGGTDDLDNLQCTCKTCNRLKDNLLPNEFSILVYRILENSIEIEKTVKSC